MPHTNEVELLANGGWDERILICHNGALVQTFIVISERYVVLVDTLINAQTAATMLAYARPYLENGRQLLVINTHADYDHAWGNQIFVGPDALAPAPIFGHEQTLSVFQEPDSAATLARMQGEEPDIFADVQLTPPTVLFRDRVRIQGGDLTLELFPTPGHTRDHVSIYLPELDTLLAADGAELPFPVARTADGLPQMRASLANMAAINAATVLYCHAPATSGPQLLHDNIAYFDALEAACRRALAQGVPADPPADADIITLVNCPFEAATPAGEPWASMHPYYRTTAHSEQIRMMLQVLGAAGNSA